MCRDFPLIPSRAKGIIGRVLKFAVFVQITKAYLGESFASVKFGWWPLLQASVGSSYWKGLLSPWLLLLGLWTLFCAHIISISAKSLAGDKHRSSGLVICLSVPEKLLFHKIRPSKVTDAFMLKEILTWWLKKICKFSPLFNYMKVLTSDSILWVLYASFKLLLRFSQISVLLPIELYLQVWMHACQCYFFCLSKYAHYTFVLLNLKFLLHFTLFQTAVKEQRMENILKQVREHPADISSLEVKSMHHFFKIN